MAPTLKIALSQIRHSPRRYVSVLIAIVIGTMFLAGALLVGSTSTATLKATLGETYSTSDVVLSPDPYSDAALLLADPDTQRELEELDTVAEAYSPSTTYVPLGTDTEPNAAPLLLQPAPRDHSLVATEPTRGELPAHDGSGEIALNAEAAEKLGLDIGDTFELEGPNGPVTATLTGTLPSTTNPMMVYGYQAIGSTDLVEAFNAVPSQDPETGDGSGQPATDESAEQADTVFTDYTLIRLADGASTDQALAELTSWAERQTADDRITTTIQVDTPEHTIAAELEETPVAAELVGVLLAFAVVALFVTMLVIANTFQVLVAQRSQQLALQRVLGATRGQVRSSVLLESFAIGLIGSVIGLGLAVGLMALLVFLGSQLLNMPQLTFGAELNLLWVLVAGVVITVVAAFSPALRATRVSPLAALRPMEPTGVQQKTGIIRLIIGAVLFVGGSALMVGTALVGQLLLAILGGVISFIGILLLAVLFVPGAVYGVGALLRGLGGVPGRMAQLNAVRNRSRTASTATALLVGTTLVTLMLTGGRIAQAQADKLLTSNFPVDAVITELADPATTAEDIEQFEHVQNTAVIETVGTYEDSSGTLQQVQSAQPDALTAVGIPDQDVEMLEEKHTVLLPSWIEQQGQDLGHDPTPQTLEVTGADGTTLTLTVQRTETSLQNPLVSPATAEALGGPMPAESLPDSPDSAAPVSPGGQVWFSVDDGLSMNELTELFTSINTQLDETANVTAPAAEKALYQMVIDMLLLIVVALLAISVIIALVGVANTLSLSTMERTRENSLMRALGLTRGGLRSMLAWEAMLIAAVGAVLGCVLGVFYGWAGAQALFQPLLADDTLSQSSSEVVGLTVPWVEMLIILAVAALAGLLASIAPARRAVKTPPVQGLAME
ncbi:ABC transporter permease [Auritidibacter ignavus]|uniref:ABC transporter permease n=1 Tax=Auritidibacter ignavus TaxID=678932 RepID=UPI0024497A04|nr:FtsX-like permease family protein [Auritidibacter ignavus]WGH85668.1 FtsX-like permease family protein [Auritidibacter ignavus]WGH87956.1 FtsX-like permease family protein [Auritidibacter ignavus]